MLNAPVKIDTFLFVADKDGHLFGCKDNNYFSILMAKARKNIQYLSNTWKFGIKIVILQRI